jgi:hypothetical protein
MNNPVLETKTRSRWTLEKFLKFMFCFINCIASSFWDLWPDDGLVKRPKHVDALKSYTI